MESKKAQLCSECGSLSLSRKEFEEPYYGKPILSLNVQGGTWAQLKSSALTCDLCCLILYAYSRNLQDNQDASRDEKEWTLQWSRIASEYTLDGRHTLRGVKSALFPRLKDQASDITYGIRLIDSQDTDIILQAREIPPAIDVDMIKRWVKTCHDDHNGICDRGNTGNIGVDPPLEQLRCINVVKNCLEYIGMEKKYIALSYVWGQHNRLLTIAANFHEFSVPRAFLNVRLPRTIADAIVVTNKLGYEYLWVDSLCIIQDCTQEVAHLINHMSSIFGHADLTIIAASGTSAQAGLSGWGLKARNLSSCNIGPDLRVGVLPNFDKELLKSPYSSRGWTYQEGVLSSRSLVFLNNQVYFHCKYITRREDMMTEHDVVQSCDPTHTLGRTTSEQPLRLLDDHIQEYTRRVLTLDGDIHNAFVGIERALSASVMKNTAFFFGLPATAFDWGLLWFGAYNSTLRRRPEFPSWSWMGWKGHISMPDCFRSTGADSLWLRVRTWIDWRFFHDGSSVSVWDPQDKAQVWVDPLPVEGRTDIKALIDEQKYENDDDDDKWDDKQCPSYGFPTQGNPFGRTSTQKLLFLQSYMQHPQAIVSQDFSMLPNYPCLRISTVRCWYHIEIASLAGKEPMWTFGDDNEYNILRGKDTNIHGIVHMHGGLQLGGTLEQQEVEVLILSYTAPGAVNHFLTNSLNKEWGGNIGTEDSTDFINTRFYGAYYWNLMNILLVRRLHDCPLVVERVGIGVLRKSGIEASLQPPRWTELFLA